MGLGSAKRGNECLRLGECGFYGLRGVIYELGKLNYKLKDGFSL